MTELSPGAKALLEAARRAPSSPSDEAVERMEATVMAAVGVGAASGAAGAAAKGVWTAAMGKVVLGAALLVVGGLVGAALVWRPAAPAAIVQSPPRRQPTVPVQPPAPAPPPSVASAPVPVPVPVVAPPSTPKPRAEVKPPPVVLAPAPRPLPSVLPTSGELALLRVAMEHIDGLEWKEGLAQLDRHDAEFPRGALQDEADVLRVLALCGLEQVSPAVELAARLRARSPNSPALARLSSSCVNP